MNDNANTPNSTGAPGNSDAWKNIRAYVRRHVVWTAIYVIALVVAAVNMYSAVYAKIPTSNVENVVITWGLVFIALIFMQIFTTPIPLPSPKNMDEIEIKNSEQRRRWMIFSYGFMLASILGVVYVFSIGWQNATQQSLMSTNAPLSVFVGCSVDNTVQDILCQKSKPEQAGAAANAGSQGAIRGTWVLNLGGSVTNAITANKTQKSTTADICQGGICKVSGGILVPLYVVLLALLGGSVSLTRRLPEYQARASVGYIPTEKNPKLSQHQFREYLVFQIVQFLSAPLLAILAYYLVEPNNITQTVALSFTAGFASETILIMIRGVTDKIMPTTASTIAKDEAQQGAKPATEVGSLQGVIRHNSKPEPKAEVSVIDINPNLKAVTDTDGHFEIKNIPIGNHSIEVVVPTSDPKKPLKKSESITIKKANEAVTLDEDF